MRKLNKIEEHFYNAFVDYENEVAAGELSIGSLKGKFEVLSCFGLDPHKIIGPYEVDFLYDRCIVEIDGQEYHKTKEQRDHDYKRERYLQKQGFIAVRFTGTEVFLDARNCIIEMLKINDVFEDKAIEDYQCGINAAHKAGD